MFDAPEREWIGESWHFLINSLTFFVYHYLCLIDKDCGYCWQLQSFSFPYILLPSSLVTMSHVSSRLSQREFVNFIACDTRKGGTFGVRDTRRLWESRDIKSHTASIAINNSTIGHLISSVIARKTSTGTGVTVYRLQNSMQKGQLPYWCDHRLCTKIIRFGPMLSPQMQIGLIDNIQLVHVTADQ